MSLLFFLFINTYSFSAEAGKDKNVLILFAMGPSTPAYRVITDGIRSRLIETYGDGYNLHMEYLEIERYPDRKFPCEQFDQINDKYDNIDFDLLICIGVDIVSNVERCAGKKIRDLPAIIIDYDLAEWGIPLKLTLNDKNLIIGIKPNIRATLESALNLFPDRNQLYILCGTSPTDLMYLRITKAMVPFLSREMKLTYFEDISMDDALNLVRTCPDSCLIFIPGFNTDSKMVFYYNPEAIRLISHAANAPVFSISDMGFGEGAVGGYILSFRKTGLLAGDYAVKIMNSLDPNTIKVAEDDYYEEVYDYRELKRWGVQGSKLIPKHGKIEFKDNNFLNEYKWFISAGIIFLFIQLMLIINLIRLYRKQKLIASQLVAAENKYRELIREDRILRLGQLTASLSHELNQPLTAILSTAQAGLRFIDSGNNDPELMKEILQNIVEDDKRTASTLGSLRSMMKLEKRDKEKVILSSLIEEVILILHGEATHKNIILDFRHDDNPVFVLADRTQIQQVILNFVLNAIQSVEKARSMNRKIIIVEKVTGDEVTVTVRDYGSGIDDLVKQKLFRPFVTSKREGTGIGLAISHSIIDDHNGRIWAENAIGGGAIFGFSLKTI